MDNSQNQNELQNMHETEGVQKINKLEEKIDTTQYNIEVSNEIMDETPSDRERSKLIEKNIQRQHAIVQ